MANFGLNKVKKVQENLDNIQIYGQSARDSPESAILLTILQPAHYYFSTQHVRNIGAIFDQHLKMEQVQP